MSTNAQKMVLGPFFNDGELLTGVKLYHYEAGSVGYGSIKHIWQDRSKSIQLAQPFVSDANGILSFFADGLYKLIVCKSTSTGPSSDVLYTWDNFSILDTVQSVFEEGEAISASSTITVGPGIWTHVIGSAPISLITGDPPFQWLVFDGDVTLSHSASLILPGSRNRTFKANDVALFLNEGSNVWRLAMHTESDGAYLGRQGSGYAATTTLAVPADGSFVDVGGADVNIAGVATTPAGYHFMARFTGSGCQLLHSASLVCPNSDDYRLITNEIIEFRSLGAGTWIVAFRSGPTPRPATIEIGMFSTAADGYLLPIGTAIVCSRYVALAKKCIALAVSFGYTGTSLGTVTFANATDTWTLAAHGLVVGDLVHLNNSGGGLPSGYAPVIPYFVIEVTTDTFKLSLTRGGAVVDGTTNGTGTHTVHNKCQLPTVNGRTMIPIDNLGGVAAGVIGAGTVLGANAQILGATYGEESHVISIGELPGTNEHPSATSANGKSMMDNSPTAGTGFGLTGPALSVGAQIRW